VRRPTPRGAAARAAGDKNKRRKEGEGASTPWYTWERMPKRRENDHPKPHGACQNLGESPGGHTSGGIY
jgi:hypothetical protein